MAAAPRSADSGLTSHCAAAAEGEALGVPALRPQLQQRNRVPGCLLEQLAALGSG